MKLKKLVPFIGYLNYVELLDGSKIKCPTLFKGSKYNIPKKYFKWYLNVNEEYEAIDAAHYINECGAEVPVLQIYISKKKEK